MKNKHVCMSCEILHEEMTESVRPTKAVFKKCKECGAEWLILEVMAEEARRRRGKVRRKKKKS